MYLKKSTVLAAFCSALIFTSCGTTQIADSDSAPLEQKNVVQPVEVKVSAEEIFIKKIQGINITLVSEPKATQNGRKFSSDFAVQVLDEEGTPVSGVEVNIKYPSDKKEGVLVFENKKVLSSEEGLISFAPDSVNFACKSQVEFSLSIPEDVNESDEEVQAEVSKKTVTVPYLVKSDVVNKGAVLFVWDFNERNKATSNSYTILSELRKRGVYLIGNAPVSDKAYIDLPIKKLYDANYEIIGGTQYGYLIYGTVKFEEPVSEVENGWKCSLVFDMTGIKMTNGSKSFSSTVKHTAVGKNWNDCVSKCKAAIAEKAAEELIYGL